MKSYLSFFAAFLLLYSCVASAQPSPIQSNVAVAWHASCAIEASGEIVCWGSNDDDERLSPAGEFLQIAGDQLKFCAIRSDKAVVCWGSERGSADTIPVAGEWDEVYVGQYQSCARRHSGEVTCWRGNATAPELLFTQIDVGRNFVCGLDQAGAAHCWGDDSRLVNATPDGTFSQLFTTSNSACAKPQTGEWQCWGDHVNSEGLNEHEWLALSGHDEIGLGRWCGIKSDYSLTCLPRSLDGAAGVIDIEVGGHQTCAVKRSGQLHCTGFFPQNFIAKTQQSEQRTLQLTLSQGGEVTVSDSGDDLTTCTTDCVVSALPSNTVTLTARPMPGYRFVRWSDACNGTNVACTLATERFKQVSAQFVQASDAPNTDYQYLSIASWGGCAVSRDQALLCWGDDSGVGVTEPPSGSYLSVELGEHFGCAITATGDVRCWGDPELPVVAAVPTITQVTEIALGDNHACARTTTGQGICWGANDAQQAELSVDNAVSIAAGEDSSCAVLNDGHLACSGRTEVANDAEFMIKFIDVADLQVSDYGLCALMHDGRMECASRNPLPPPTLNDFYDMSLDGTYVCGINALGTGRCNVSFDDYTMDSGLQDIAISGNRVCALSDLGRIACWYRDDPLQPPFADSVRFGPASDEVTVNVQFNGKGVLYDQDGAVLCDDDCVLTRRSTAAMTLKVDAGRFAYWTGDCVGYESRCTITAQRDTSVTAHLLSELPHKSLDGSEAFELSGRSGCYFDSGGNLRCFTQATVLPQLNYPSTQNFTAVALGSAYCGLRYNQQLHCWSSGLDERVRNVPSGEYTQLGSGSGFACALDANGKLSCWGRSGFAFTAPVGDGFDSLSVYNRHACVLNSAGRAVCWGTFAEYYPAPDTIFEQVSVSHLLNGRFGACGITASGAVECWGEGSTVEPPGQDVAQVSTTNWGGCAVLNNGELSCWGTDAYGQQQVPDGRFVSVMVTTYGVCAMRVSGEIVCWGEAYNYVTSEFTSVFEGIFAGSARPSSSSGLLMLIMAWQALQDSEDK